MLTIMISTNKLINYMQVHVIRKIKKKEVGVDLSNFDDFYFHFLTEVFHHEFIIQHSVRENKNI